MNKARIGFFLMAFVLLLTTVAFAGTYTFPENIKEIDDYAFFDNAKMDVVVLPDGIERIGYEAFGNSSLTSINLPESLTYIDDTAFSGCTELTKVTAKVDTYAYDWAVQNGYIKGGDTSLPKPSSLIVSALSCTELSISWDAVEDAVYYNVYYSTVNQASKYVIHGKVDAPNTSYVLDNLAIDTKYYVKVAPVSAYGVEGAMSSSKYATTDELIAPTLTVEEKTFTSVSLSWKSVEDAAGYTVYMSTSTTSSSFTECGKTDADTTSYTVPNLPADDTYYSTLR